MIRVSLPLLILVLVGGCKNRDKDGPPLDKRDPGTPEDTWPQWEVRAPILEAQEWWRGTSAEIRVVGAPPGAEVTFYESRISDGEGPCLVDDPAVCLRILEPTVIGTWTANDEGIASTLLPIAADAKPDAVYLQAIVFDPVQGAWTTSQDEIRHVGMPVSEAKVQFRGVNAGMDQVLTMGNTHTGGVAWFDYNGDHWPDVFVSNGGQEAFFLYRNNGDGTFTPKHDLIQKPAQFVEAAGARFGDIDNDGDDDLLVLGDTPYPMNGHEANPYCGWGQGCGPNMLYINNGNGTFSEEAGSRGLLDDRGWRNICGGLSDYDLDGDLDTYFGNWAMNSAIETDCANGIDDDEDLMTDEEDTECQGGGDLDNFDKTYKNDGTGHFVESTDTTGIDGAGRDVLACMWFDLDFDLLPDLYITNTSDPDLHDNGKLESADDNFYKNLDGEHFEDIFFEDPNMGDDAWTGMGMDIGDYDNDGDWDFYLTDRYIQDDPSPRGNVLYNGTPEGGWTDNLCDEADLCMGHSAWPTNWVDFDNDGLSDLWIGSTRPEIPDMVYFNEGDGTFALHDQEDFDARREYTRGGAVADYDGDGDVDVFVWVDLGSSRLFDNDLDTRGGDNHWAELELSGVTSNRSAIGAVLRFTTADGVTQLRKISGGDSAHSQSMAIVHVGLGEHTVIDTLEITWPLGQVDTFQNVPADAFYLFDEADGMVQEALSVDATWTAATQTLRVTTTSNFGGRTAPSAQGLGDLSWDPETLSWVLEQTGVPDPGTVTVQTERGADEVVAVQPL